MKYDVIFADLDGTLLADDKSLPKSNVEAIKKIKSLGIDFVVCSGRSHMSLKNMNMSLYLEGVEGYGIGFNGGSIFTREPYKVIHQRKFSVKSGEAVLKFLRNYNNAEMMMYTRNMLIVEKMSKITADYIYHSKIAPKKVRNLEMACHKPINKIILIGDNNVLKGIKADFDNNKITSRVDCFFSSDTLLEFNPVNVSKGTAIKKLMEFDEFKGKKTISIGDSYNDVPMFEATDFSVACKNSNDDVKSGASVVSENNNNEGILLEFLE